RKLLSNFFHSKVSAAMKIFLLAFFTLLLPAVMLWGQRDTLPTELIPDLSEQRLEDLLQDADEEADFDLNTIFEDLATYQKNPLNLNEATEEAIRDLGLLSDVQISNLLAYRETMQGFIAIYELQAVEGMDVETIRRILPFVNLGRADADNFQASLKEMLTTGDNELYLRWNRVLETQRGFRPLEERPDSTPYLGDPNQLYFRFRHFYSNRLSIGFTAEKDRGEEFFTGSNRKGFDYYSAHFFLQDYNKRLRALALGDYTANFGQGLILFAGFGYGKSSLVTSVRRGGRTLRKYSSVNEALFLRGAATTLALSDRLELTALVSWRGRDGNLLQAQDTLDNDFDNDFTQFSSLNLSGLHRTAAEIEDRNAIQHTAIGASVKWKATKGHIALNAVHNRLDKTLTLTPRVYNRFYFSGNQLTNASVDYSWRIRNLTLFGETAWSDNGAIATINGLLTTLHRNVNFAVVQRSYPRHFQTLLGDPFGETSGGRNEKGIYAGIEIHPFKHWIISAYYDVWEHPWLRVNADAPSRGQEYRFRITYFEKRRLDAYVELRNEIKGVNVKVFDSNLDALLPQQRLQMRLHCAYQINKALEWRGRLDWGLTDNPINNQQQGFGIYQDILFTPIGMPFSFTSRIAYFDTDGYQVRFYNYEQGLLYNFSIPPYYNQGTRFYLNVRYKGIRNLTLEARYARTYWANQDEIGSGLESTGKPIRSEVGAQLKYKF
ncbi:MAG: helix-hairpin-helix domain-containing protein, partial [Saprospiraceae bacterium]